MVKASAKMLNNRSDETQYAARDNELPAVYTNGPWYRLVTYTGTKPYTHDEVTEIPIKEKELGVFPWSRFNATENWAALLDQNGNVNRCIEPSRRVKRLFQQNIDIPGLAVHRV